jgi:hypothetical protein
MRATLGARFRNAQDLEDHLREAWAACACDSFESFAIAVIALE